MHHLYLCLTKGQNNTISCVLTVCQDLVRFFALLRIKPHAPPLVRAPVNSFEFHTCVRTPQVGYLSLSLSHSDHSKQLVSIVYSVDYQGI